MVALALMVSPATRALWKAVEQRKAKRAAKAIEEGADPNALAGVGAEELDQLSALHRAVQLCVPALVDAIAEAAKRKGVALEWGLPSSRYGYTPLMMATVGGSQRRPEPSPAQEAATVVAALKAGAQVSIDDRGATGVFMVSAGDLSYTPLLHYLSMGREREGCAQALLEAGAQTLWERVEMRNLVSSLELGGCNTHGADALMLAVEMSFSSHLVQALLDKGACLAHQDAEQRTALMLAIRGTRGPQPVVAAAHASLIVNSVRARGAAFDQLPWPRELPPTRMADALEVPDPHGYRALHYAASFGCVALVSELLAGGADREAHCVSGWTPLMVAAGSRQAGALKALLEAGAFANNHNGFGVTALHVAVVHGPSGGELGCLDALLAWPDTDVHATTITGLTPLVLAGLCGNILAIARVKLRIAGDAASGKCRDPAARERERLSALSGEQLKAELVARNILATGLVELAVAALLAPPSAASQVRTKEQLRDMLVAALLKPPSAASQVRMKDQLRNIVEKVSYIGMPASKHVLVWGRLPLLSYRKGSAVLRAFPDNDLMGSGAMWCRDGHGWCGDEVPHGATAEMTESRRRGPYMRPYMQLLQEREGEDEVDDEGELSDGRWKHRPIDTSGVNDMQFVGFPLRWRVDFRVLLSRSEDVAGSLDYVEVRGCWALGTINTPSAAGLATGIITFDENPIRTFSHQGDDLGPRAPFCVRPPPGGVVPPEVAEDLARRMQLMSKGNEITEAMDASALATGTDAATAKPLSCSTCGKPPAPGAALSACGRCKTALYCSKACQTEAWPGHKHVCKAVGEAVAKAERKVDWPGADREAAL